MEKRIFGRTLVEVNRLGFGGIPIQRLELSEAIETIRHAVERGINFIDTARGYTISEKYIGYALNKVDRSKLFIATKSMARSYEDMKNDIEISLQNLQTSYIDLYQVHNLTSEKDLDIVLNGAYKALREAKKEGKIKYIGITSHNYDFLWNILDLDLFDSIQFPYNIVENKSKDLFKKAHDLKVGTICMKPLAGGAIDNGLIAIKYLLNDENVDVIIPGVSSKVEIDNNILASKGEYSLEEKNYIDKITKTLDNDFCRRCGYCLPCPKGIDIPSCFLFEGYYSRYDLKDWAVKRYDSLKHKASECVSCGACIIKCPYNLNIPKKLKEVANVFEK